MRRLLQKNGWWSLEILLTVALCVTLCSTGGVMMYQVMGLNNGLYPRNQLEQVQLSRILMEIEDDFSQASRVYVWDSCIQEQVSSAWGPLSSNTHTVSDMRGDLNIWNLSIAADEDDIFLDALTQSGSSTVYRSSAPAAEKNYTLLFLGGGAQINAVVYLRCFSETPASGVAGITYVLTRYINNENRLVKSSEFTYHADGATFLASDQSETANAFPYIQRSATGFDCIEIRLPTAFSKALRDIGTGKVSGRVKKTADEWGVWTFAARQEGHWLREY